jgi:hypothetical protein
VWSATDHLHVATWSPDGRFLLLERQSAETGNDIWLLPLDGSGSARALVETRFQEANARISPDGRWMAYVSDESGSPQVYVQPFPDLGAKWQASTSEGSQPVWSRDGHTLFYRGEGAVWAVDVRSGEVFSPGIPRRLLDDTFETKGLLHTGYDVAPDGRFLTVGTTGSPRPEGDSTIHIIENWLTEVTARVSTEN